MPTTYVQRSTASDLSVPGEYDLQLLEGAVTLVDRVIQLALSQTKEGYHYTPPGVPGAGGMTGDYTVAVDIAVGDTQVLVSAAVARVNSSGAVQAQSAFSAEQVSAGAVLNFSFTNVNLGTWTAGERLRAAVRYRNQHTHTARSVTVSFNTVDCQVVAPWSSGATVVEGVAAGANAYTGTAAGVESSPPVEGSAAGSYAHVGSIAGSAAYRLRARLRFTAGSGMAQWCFDQNVVRLGQAYHLNEGTANEEQSHHEVADDVYSCDLVFPELALAQNTWSTLTDASVLAWLRPDEIPDGESWADMHQCAHEAEPPVPCPAREWVWP